MFNSQDIQHIIQHGLDPDEIERQYTCITNGLDAVELVRPATIGDGILALDDTGKNAFSDYFLKHAANYDCLKFVPASGAATRMFKDLITSYQNKKISPSTELFLKHVSSFAFYHLLKSTPVSTDKPLELLNYLLFNEGLNLSQKPKAVIPFHVEDEIALTPLYSHLIEGLNYSLDHDGVLTVHFTFSREHFIEAEQLLWDAVFQIEEQYGIESSIRVSEQFSSTDTIALHPDNSFLRDDGGQLVFRPGGHGSLLANLNECEADFIFIRNIDNVLPPKKNTETVFYKQVMGGMLMHFIEARQSVFAKIKNNDGSAFSDVTVLLTDFGSNLPQAIDDLEKLEVFLNRPVRICAMVKNEGEPGGGPFWIRDKSGNISLQIIETSQIANINAQKDIAAKSTHFNPVDMVCYIKNKDGEFFDLHQFRDESTAFIVEKTVNGKVIKGIEHPGLWNGSMANWLTIFVEVPVSIFNPVKTINDLLRHNHIA